MHLTSKGIDRYSRIDSDVINIISKCYASIASTYQSVISVFGKEFNH